MLDKLSQYHQRGLSCTKQQACMVWEHFGKIVKLPTIQQACMVGEHFGKIVKLQTIHVLARSETRKPKPDRSERLTRASKRRQPTTCQERFLLLQRQSQQARLNRRCFLFNTTPPSCACATDLARAQPPHHQGPHVVHPGSLGQDWGRPPGGDGVDREPDQRWRRGWSRGQELIGDIELGIFCVSEAQHGLPSTCDRYGPGLPFSPLSKEGDEFAVSTPLGTSSSRSFAEKSDRSLCSWTAPLRTTAIPSRSPAESRVRGQYCA